MIGKVSDRSPNRIMLFQVNIAKVDINLTTLLPLADPAHIPHHLPALLSARSLISAQKGDRPKDGPRTQSRLQH